MKFFQKSIPKSQFTRNVFVLMTGTGLAQAIAIALSPILTRIYSPDDFGILALYLAIVSIMGIFGTGRYEMAIMFPKEEEEVGKIVSIIVSITSIFAAVLLVVVCFFNTEIAIFLGNRQIAPWLYLLPISLFINSIYQIINYLLIREKSFKQLATNKVIYSSSNSVLQMFFGILKMGGLGMLISSMTSYIVAILVVLRNRTVFETFKRMSVRGLKDTIIRYKKFPIYDMPAASINLFSNQLPILALGKFFSSREVGLYSFMFKILSTPLSLLSNSILDVFKQKATEDFLEFGNCRTIYVKTLRSLFVLSIIPFAILFFLGPPLFAFVFGEVWRDAGRYAQILAPMFMLKFISSPLSYVFYVFEKQKIDLIGQTLLLLFICIAIYVGIKTRNETTLLYFYSISYSVVYLCYLGFSYMLSKGTKQYEESH